MRWTAPDTKRVMEAVDGSWPAAAFIPCGPFMLRRGEGGGKRVSAASVVGAYKDADIRTAEAEMCTMGQPRLFQLSGEVALDGQLESDGYQVIDPVILYAAPPADLSGDRLEEIEEPSKELVSYWAGRNVGEGRINIMRRTAAPKVCLAIRDGEDIIAAAYFAVDGDVGMIHAVDVHPDHRRKDLGRKLMQGAANWATRHHVESFTLAVIAENRPARALYASMGMQECGAYHYRIKE